MSGESGINIHIYWRWCSSSYNVTNFKYVLENAPVQDCTVIIDANMRPSGQHNCRFNASTTNEVAILAGPEEAACNIGSRLHDGVTPTGFKNICKVYCSCDTLQYPLIYVRGKDGYYFGLMLLDPTTKLQSPITTVSFKKLLRLPFHGSQ